MKIREIEKLSLEHARWYGASQECYIVRFEGHAPTKEFAIINERGRYDTNPATGYLRGNGNLGTGSLLFTDLKALGNAAFLYKMFEPAERKTLGVPESV